MRKVDFKNYFQKGRKKYYLSNKEIKNKTIAVLVDESIGVGKIDFIFTTEGIILDKAFTGFNETPNIIPYKKINNDNNKLDINGESYKNKEINMFALFDLIQELAELSASINPENAPAGYLSYKDTYLIESNDD